MLTASPTEISRADASLPTRWGDFRISVFRFDGTEVVALVRGDVSGPEPVLVRLHSECLTGDVLGSLRCDCGDQLRASLAMIGTADRGVLLYLDHEGRGIGLFNKVRAYGLQDGGLDTVDANVELGLPVDARDYSAAASSPSGSGFSTLTRTSVTRPNRSRRARATSAVTRSKSTRGRRATSSRTQEATSAMSTAAASSSLATASAISTESATSTR